MVVTDKSMGVSQLLGGRPDSPKVYAYASGQRTTISWFECQRLIEILPTSKAAVMPDTPTQVITNTLANDEISRDLDEDEAELIGGVTAASLAVV